MRSARTAEYERVGDVTIAAYERLEVDHLFDGYDAQIRDTAGRAERADVLVAVDAGDSVLGSVTFVSDPESPWLEWTDPGEVQPRFRIDLEVVATDVNVEGGPKQGRNLEPIRLMVWEDLLVQLRTRAEWRELAGAVERLIARTERFERGPSLAHIGDREGRRLVAAWLRRLAKQRLPVAVRRRVLAAARGTA